VTQDSEQIYKQDQGSTRMQTTSTTAVVFPEIPQQSKQILTH